MFTASRMALVAAVMFAATAVAQAAEVPTLDVSKTCKPIAADVPIDEERCYHAEREAHDQLAKSWNEHTASDRSMCTASATMGGTASYVGLLTCLEMKREVARLPPDRGLTTRPSRMPTK